MFSKRIRTLALLAAAGLGLGACTYGDGGYGYSGVSVGYGSGGYYDPYYGSSYYGSGFGSPYWGWYDNFYYPGTGYYVYDRYRRPHRWTDSQRRYWAQRRQGWRGHDRDRPRNNWGDFRPGDGRPGDGRPGTRPWRPGEGRPGVRPDRPGEGRPGVRPGRPGGERPGARPGRGEWRPGVRPGRPGEWVPRSRPQQQNARPGVQRPDRPNGGQWRRREGSQTTPGARPGRSWGNQGGRPGPRWGGGGRSGGPRSTGRRGPRPQ